MLIFYLTFYYFIIYLCKNKHIYQLGYFLMILFICYVLKVLLIEALQNITSVNLGLYLTKCNSFKKLN